MKIKNATISGVAIAIILTLLAIGALLGGDAKGLAVNAIFFVFFAYMIALAWRSL